MSMTPDTAEWRDLVADHAQLREGLAELRRVAGDVPAELRADFDQAIAERQELLADYQAAIGRGLGLTDLELARIQETLLLLDEAEAEYGPLDDLKLRRLIRRLRAAGRLKPGA